MQRVLKLIKQKRIQNQRKESKTNKDNTYRFTENPAWMFKEPADTEKPMMCNNKERWWCSTKRGGNFDSGKYHCELNSKCTRSDKKTGGGDSNYNRGKKISLDRAMEAVINNEDNYEEHKHDE